VIDAAGQARWFQIRYGKEDGFELLARRKPRVERQVEWGSSAE